MRELIIEFLRESNAIEGVYDDKSVDTAMEAWEYLWKQKELTANNVLKCHDILMQDHLPQKDRGQIRRVKVWVGDYEPPSPVMVGERFKSWLEAFDFSKWPFRPNEKIIQGAHVEFEKIHPFIDGNGRIGRIIYNWQRMKHGGLPVHVIYEEDRQEYYKWFK